MSRLSVSERWPEHVEAARRLGVPDLPLVKRTTCDTIEGAFRLGAATERGTTRLWSSALGEWVVWVPPQPPGQSSFVPSPNIVVIVTPRWRATEVATLEFGCTHTMESVVRRNCYYESRCTKCGYHYGVDSSD